MSYPIVNFTYTAPGSFDLAHVMAAPCRINFTDLTVGYLGTLDIYRWKWTFGDGEFSYEQNPSHVYKNVGVYTVSLEVWNNYNAEYHSAPRGYVYDIETKTNYITTIQWDQHEGEDICLRFAAEPSQGIGWTKIEGEWVWPETEFDAFNILDSNDITRSLVKQTDIYEIDTCDRNLKLTPPYLDKEGDNAEAEIETEDWLPEVMLPNNANRSQISHEVSHESIRPNRWENRGITGYTASGMRNEQEFGLDVYVDGEKITSKASSSDYPETADISFKGVRVEGERVQFVHKTTASEFRRVGVHHKLLVKPQVGTRTDRSDHQRDCQEEFLTDKALHVTRHKIRVIVASSEVEVYDKVSKEKFIGKGWATYGPDGNTNSGVEINQTHVEYVPGQGNIAVGLYFGSFPIINGSTGTTVTYWMKAGGGINYPSTPTHIGATYNGWMLYRSDASAFPYHELVFNPGSYFDIRVYNKHLGDEGILDYYNDVVKNNGKAYIPGF